MTTRSQKTKVLEQPVLVVTHIHPDTDAWLCAWLLLDHYRAADVTMDIELVPAGTALKKSDPRWKTHEIVHVDTGGGPYDQHGLELKNSSSFRLMAEALDMVYDPAVAKLLPMVNAVDNAQSVDQTSIHHFITALPYACRPEVDKFNQGSTDWSMVLDQVIFMLDTLAGKWRSDVNQSAKFDRIATIETLENGLKLCVLHSNPGLRAVAFERGADVVTWIAPKKGGFYPAVQVHSNADIDLTPVVVSLRSEEAKLRKVSIGGLSLDSFGNLAGIPGWFLHDSKRLVGCGTKTHPLEGDALTKMKAGRFFQLVREQLSA